MSSPGSNQHQHRGRSGKRLQAILLTATFYPLMALWTALGIACFPLLFVLWKLATRWDTGRVMRHLIALHGYGLIVIVSPWVRFTLEGAERIPRPCILVANHLSFFDSYFLAALPFHDLIFAVGAWPFRMYWYTLFMRLARYLNMEGDSWEHVIATCQASFANKGLVIFYPEGHRSRTGELQPFYSGAFRLAQQTGVPIVPLCFTGTGTMLPPGASLLYPCHVRLKALPAVDPREFAGPHALRREVRHRIAQELKETQKESC